MTEPDLEHAPCGWCSTGSHAYCVATNRPRLGIPCGCHDRHHKPKADSEDR